MSGERPPLAVVVLISGAGSNLRAIAEQARSGELPVEIRAVISDRPDAAGLAWAATAGIATLALLPRDFPDRAAFDRALADAVQRHEPGLVVLAGFMRILGAGFLAAYRDRVLLALHRDDWLKTRDAAPEPAGGERS